MATLQETVAPDVLAFCTREGILDHLRTALDLIQECFPDAQGMRSEMVWDPDSGEEWAALTVTVSGPEADIAERDHRFVDRWIAAVPWPARDMIVTTLDIR